MRNSEKSIVSGVSGIGKDFMLEQLRNSDELIFLEMEQLQK